MNATHGCGQRRELVIGEVGGNRAPLGADNRWDVKEVPWGKRLLLERQEQGDMPAQVLRGCSVPGAREADRRQSVEVLEAMAHRQHSVSARLPAAKQTSSRLRRSVQD